LLGGFEIRDGSGAPVQPLRRQAQAVLAILALNPGVALPRDKLIALLWSTRSDNRARNSLSHVLSDLRKAFADFDPPPLITDRETVCIDSNAVEVDAVTFEHLIDDGTPESLQRATELYQGEFLDGLAVRDPDFVEWMRDARTHLHERARAALSRLLEYRMAARQTDKAAATAKRLLLLDPTHEGAYRALMRIYTDKGDRALALKQYQTCCDVLRAELGLEPEAGTEQLAEEIRTGPARTGEAVDPAPEPRAPGTEPLPLPDKPSVVVLPFVNMSGDAEQEYFADGITEDIISGLSRFRELFVIARNSSFTYKGQPVKVQEIGEELGVRYVIEGSVRQAGNRVRITAQLVNAATGNHLWAERYDREMEDVFAIQDEVTKTVVATLAGRLGDIGVDHVKRKPTHSLTAFDYVLHARQLIYRYKRESILEAREFLEKAIALDPDYAIGHAWLSETYCAEWWAGWTADAGASFERAASHAVQAVALDDTDPQVHIQMGEIYLYRRQYDEARFHFDKALSLNPNEPNALMMQSGYSTYVGDPERAVALINEAIRVDPLGHYGFPKGAIIAFKIVRGEAQSVHAWLAACHTQSGDLRDARAAATEFVARTTKAMADMGARPPASWREFFAERLPYKHQEDMDHLLEGLRKAGLE
jgi:TolB-like protein/Tfp pilus assembly protein PilF